MTRGTGLTTQQMKAAPQGAVFVWCNDRTWYAVQLARKLGRDDLQIKPPRWLVESWQGLELTGVVVDHAARLSDKQWEGFLYASARAGRLYPAK